MRAISALRRPAPAGEIRRLVKLAGMAVGLIVFFRLFFSVFGTASAGQLIVFSLAAFGALMLLVMVRFDIFVALILVIRSSLDYTKGGPVKAGGLEPNAIIAIVFMGAGLVWLYTRGRHAPRFRSPLSGPFQLFMATVSLSVLSSSSPATSFLEWARIAAVFMMVLVLERLAIERRTVKRIIFACFLSAPIPMLVGISQVLNRSNLFERGDFERIRGTFRHPNPYALYLAVIITMGVALYPHLSGYTRKAMFVLMGGAIVVLLMTYTRTAWIVCLVALLVVGLLQSRALVGFLLGGVLLLLALVPSIAGRFADLQEARHLKSGTSANSLVWRFDYWLEAIPLAKDSPVTGIGLKMIASNLDEEKQPHNDFVRVYVETGIIGLVGYLALLTGLVRTARRGIAKARPGLDRGIAVGFAGCVTIFIIASVVSNIISQVVLLWYFYAFAIAAAAVSRDSSNTIERVRRRTRSFHGPGQVPV